MNCLGSKILIDTEAFEAYLKKAKEVGYINFENDDPVGAMTKLELFGEEWLLNAGAVLFCRLRH